MPAVDGVCAGCRILTQGNRRADQNGGIWQSAGRAFEIGRKVLRWYVKIKICQCPCVGGIAQPLVRALPLPKMGFIPGLLVVKEQDQPEGRENDDRDQDRGGVVGYGQ